jgi:endonuclease-3 related protein
LLKYLAWLDLMKMINKIYNTLFKEFGPQHWWPGETRFEIIIGAILTQNTSWLNVEKAIANLKSASVLEPAKLHALDIAVLASLIKPAGYFNVKAKRLKNFLNWLFENHNGSLQSVDRVNTSSLREQLLAIKGIGPETADSILLYAFNRPVFVVDAYTARVMVRHRLVSEYDLTYDSLQDLFTSHLEADAKMFNEYHALIVRLGKDFCKPRPNCDCCPLRHLPHDIEK